MTMPRKQNKLRDILIDPLGDWWMALAVVIITLALLFAVRKAEGQTTRPAPPFVVGAWRQPASSFQLWKSRGINTLIGTVSGVGQDALTDADYCAKAHAAGIYVIADCNDADAHEQIDEPDGVGNIAPEVIVKRYKLWKTVDSRQTLLNVDGWKTQYRSAADYAQYFQGADWIGFDYYIINRGEGPDNIGRLGERCDFIKRLAPGKRIFACIECSDQNLRVTDWAKTPDASGTPAAPRMRAPTPDEMEKEIRVCVAHGASGIIYFPDVIGLGWQSFDGTPSELSARMTSVNATLTGVPIVYPTTITPATKPVSPLPTTRAVAPRLAIRTRVLTTGNPTLLQIPNIRWTDDGKGTSPDTAGKPRWVYDFDAHDEMVSMGYEEAWMLGDDVLNNSQMWTTIDGAGNPHLAVGLKHDELDWSLSGNHNNPPDRNVSLSIGQLIAHPQTFRPNGIKPHAMVVFDIENSPVINNVWTGSPLADRLAAVNALTQSIKWIRQEAGGDQEVCVYGDHALYATTWGSEPEIQAALAEFSHSVSLRAPFLYACDWQAENSASWQSNFDSLVHNVNRFSPEHSQTVVITLCPVRQVYYPDKVSPEIAKLNGAPIPMPIWMNMVDAVAAKGYTILVWTGNSAVEPIREQLRYVAGYQRGRN